VSASTNDGGRTGRTDPSDPTEPTDRAEPTGRADRGARLVVTGGGDPDAEQLAALTVAFATTAEVSPPTSIPAWRQAGLLEGAGGAAVLAPGDLVEPGSAAGSPA